MHSKMGPVWQNPIQRTVRTAHLSVLMTCAQLQYTIQHRTALLIFPLTSRQTWRHSKKEHKEQQVKHNGLPCIHTDDVDHRNNTKCERTANRWKAGNTWRATPGWYCSSTFGANWSIVSLRWHIQFSPTSTTHNFHGWKRPFTCRVGYWSLRSCNVCQIIQGSR